MFQSCLKDVCTGEYNKTVKLLKCHFHYYAWGGGGGLKLQESNSDSEGYLQQPNYGIIIMCIQKQYLLWLQEDCLTKAEFCFSQARLVALQLSVLQQGKQVINLDARRVLKYMEEQPFSEVRTCIYFFVRDINLYDIVICLNHQNVVENSVYNNGRSVN